MTQVDYIIIGQGICGTMLSWNLMKAGKSVMVVDEAIADTASKVASGVINPVTGRRIVRTWEIEKIMPFAVKAYKQLEIDLDIPLIRQANIFDFHPTPQMMLAFADRLSEETTYLRVPENTDQLNTYFNFHFGVGEINPCWLIDINTLLDRWRNKLKQHHALLEQRFNWDDCVVTSDQVTYAGITASAIICCEGAAGSQNPYFHLLPYALNKGEVIIAEIDGLPDTHMYKQGINLVPWKDGLWWIGSTYEWDFTDTNPTAAFREKTATQLKQWLKLPYRIVDHMASVRPANVERRPFVGLHPAHTRVGVFNGMGTKGCSLAPFFASEFYHCLVEDQALSAAVDIKRFTRILSR